MKSTFCVSLLLAVLSQFAAVESFAPRLLCPHQPLSRSRPVFAATTFRTFLSGNEQQDSPKQRFLKQLENQEANLLREREKTRDRLLKYEQSLETLKSMKAEYMVRSDAPTRFTETTVRSIVKSLLWRFIAGLVTFVASLNFSGSLATAFKVVGADFFSKAFTMFVGERIMNKSQAGRQAGSDAAGRSLAKALIWRLFAVTNTLTMAIFIAKDLSVASKIASTDAITKTGLMFLYERVWARVEWGKVYQMEWNL